MIDALEAGVDEVGRGPLAGPVEAAAVCLNPSDDWQALRDSKRLSAQRRAQLDGIIREQAAAWALGIADVEEIDALNIRGATHLAMQRAVNGLRPAPVRVVVDGNDAPTFAYPARAVIGGDGLIAAISAASIIAKVYRDGVLEQLHEQYPDYGFNRHRGYPTAYHRRQLARLGPCPAHRCSFAPVRAALAFNPETESR